MYKTGGYNGSIIGLGTMEPLNKHTDLVPVVSALARLCKRFRLPDTAATLETTLSIMELGWQSQWVQGKTPALMQRRARGL